MSTLIEAEPWQIEMLGLKRLQKFPVGDYVARCFAMLTAASGIWMGVFLVLHAFMRGQGCWLVLYSFLFLLARGYPPPVGGAIVVVSFKLYSSFFGFKLPRRQ